MNSSGIVLVHATLKCHGFRQTNKDNWNVMWTSCHLKSYVFQVRLAFAQRAALLCHPRTGAASARVCGRSRR